MREEFLLKTEFPPQVQKSLERLGKVVFYFEVCVCVCVHDSQHGVSQLKVGD